MARPHHAGPVRDEESSIESKNKCSSELTTWATGKQGYVKEEAIVMVNTGHQVEKHVSESVDIRSRPAALYEAVSDVGRMGEWSPEATGAKIITKGPVQAGSRFRGSNRKGWIHWSTQCVVVNAVPGEEFTFEVRVLGSPVARWSYHFSPIEGGTRVEESWTDLRSGFVGFVARSVGAVVLGTPDRANHNRRTMRITLDRLKRSMETANHG